MSSLIDLINKFENSLQQDVKTFNTVFPLCPLLIGIPSDEVEIGKILGPVNMRELKVGQKEISHLFNIVTTSKFTEGFKYSEFATNDSSENLVLDEKELKLDPFEYKLLQYFRGCQSNLHTQQEIAARMFKSLKGVRSALTRMEKKNIIKSTNLVSIRKMSIAINEEWN